MQLPNLESSLQELDGDAWGEPSFKSHLATEAHRLRTIPLSRLSIENLRLLIGQNIGLEFLIPVALNILTEDPFAEGDFYPGDLLLACMRADKEYWTLHEDELSVLNDIAMDLDSKAQFLNHEVLPAWKDLFS